MQIRSQAIIDANEARRASHPDRQCRLQTAGPFTVIHAILGFAAFLQRAPCIGRYAQLIRQVDGRLHMRALSGGRRDAGADRRY